MKKKKVGLIILIIAIAIMICFHKQIISIFITGEKSDERVYVEQIASMNGGIVGASSRFNGVVESQEVVNIEVDTSRKVSKVHVNVGDEITEGQTLVTYDTGDLELQLNQASLEKESILNDIAGEEKQIELLKQQMESLSEEEKFAYNTQIQNIQNSISQKKYDIESKQLEIDKIKAQINNSTIKAEVSGIVKVINERSVDEMGNSAPFMSILQNGDYRIKGSIDEQNIWTIAEGQSVIIRSRVDENKTWMGNILKIDTENVQENSNNMYGDGEVVMASKYPFYIELENSEGLILGQHVYIELDEGQSVSKEGLWLYSFYIVQENESAYVWTANEKNKLEKRVVELGEYDVDMDQYRILSGLTEEDYIAWPMEGLYEGVTTVTNIEEENWNYETDESMEGTEWY